MSSSESNLNEPSSGQAGTGPSKGSVALVAVTLGLLAALVWALNPSQPKLVPAPLHPQPPGCAKLPREFTPTNFTDLPDFPGEALPPGARYQALLRLNTEPCPCGCVLSIAACRLNYPPCGTSLELAKKTLAEVKQETGSLRAK